jgi:hypothetical protein
MITKIIAVSPDNDNISCQYLSHKTVKGIVNKLLICDRIVLKPTRVRAYTLEELASELRITPLRVRNLRAISQLSWKSLAPELNLPLIDICCRTKFCD